MYKYGIKGWKSDLSTGSYNSVKPNFGLAFNGLASSDRLEEEDSAELDEAADVAAPLPSSDDRLGRVSSVKSRPNQLHSDVSVTGDKEEGSCSGPRGKLLAKDKRKLREKRRSTGVAKYLSETSDQSEELADRDDTETKINTSINETSAEQEANNASAIGNHQRSTTVETSAATIREDAAFTSCPLSSDIISECQNSRPTDCTSSQNSVSGSTNCGPHLVEHRSTGQQVDATDTSSAAVVSVGESGILNGIQSLEEVARPSSNSNAYPSQIKAAQLHNSHGSLQVAPSGIQLSPGGGGPKLAPRPEPPMKPALAAKRWTGPTHSLAPRPVTDSQSADVVKSQEERRQLQNRLVVLEKLLEEERKENAALKELLISKDQQIAELDSEVNALNEDLDLADEECCKLEDENKVLLRAMSELTTQE